MILTSSAIFANIIRIGEGKTRTEACVKAKDAAGVFGTYETKDCECSQREKSDPLYESYPWVCSAERK